MATYYRWRQSTAEYEATKIRDNGYWANNKDEPIYLLTSRSVEYRNGRFHLVRDGTYHRYPFDFGESEYLNGQYFEVESVTNQAYASDSNTRIAFYSGHVQIDAGNCYRLEATVSPGTFVGYVYSTNASAYPNGGASGNYYYDQRTTVESPTAPASITVPESIKGGDTITISWGAATGTAAAVSGYALERQASGGSWVQVFRGNALTTTNLVEKGTTMVAYRVRAYDANNQYSGYTTSPTRVVVNNTPPTAPGTPVYKYPVSGQSLNVTWTAATDPDANPITYTVERSIDSAEFTEVGSTSDLMYQVPVPTVQEDNHTIAVRIKATDSEGASSDYATGSTETIVNLYHKVVKTIPWTKGIPFFARQFTFNYKDQYQTMLEGALASTEGLPIIDDVFANNTWQNISYAARNNLIPETWQVGDTKDIVVNDETLTLAIMDFNHDDRADGSGKAGITMGMTQCMADGRQMNSTDTNVNSFSGSAMYDYLVNTVLAGFPEDLLPYVVPVNKKTSAGNKSSSILTEAMSIWLFSEIEVFGTTTYSVAGEGSQYPYFATTENRIKKLSNGTGAASYWWERSPYQAYPSAFCSVASGGTPSFNYSSGSIGVCFGFCL